MFVPIEEGFQRKSIHSQKGESMSDEEEHEFRCGESFPMSALNPQRSAATPARCSFPLAIRVQHRARGEDLVCGPQRRDLREMKTRPCAQGEINAPPRLTSQNISPAPFRLSLPRGPIFQEP
jgi:hypothetical protein